MEEQKMINPIVLKTLSRSISILSVICIVFFTSCKDEAPTCVISEPADDAVYLQGATVTIEVDADDDDGTLFRKPSIDQVRFLIDDDLVATVTAAPYSYAWNTASEALGYHDIVTVAEDNGGNTTQDEISVLLNDAPSCDITNPVNNTSTFQGSVVDIAVDADDDIGGLNSVEFYVDNSLIGTDNSSPFSYGWETESSSTGSHTVKAIAIDNYDAETSDQVTVQVQECLVCGVWEAEYSGYDPQTQRNITIKRTLAVNKNTAYNDTLYGKPEDQSTFIQYQIEAGNWKISEDGQIINWTPTSAQRINIDNGQLESYTATQHDDQITLGEDNKAWRVRDENLDVDYDLRKKQ
jgi:hypothetical protein